MSATKSCTRCGELLPVECFYFVSKSRGTRRGQCKACVAEVRAEQRDPGWLPACARCGQTRSRIGPGRRLCDTCFSAAYDEDALRDNGSSRLKLKPCSACGARRLRADHVKGTTLCPVCRGVSQSRRKSLKAYYNMTPREYVGLLAAQGDRCVICARSFSKSRVPHIDHRHEEPSLIRGAICGPCNTLLGVANDSTSRLLAAAAYLQAPPAQVLFPGRTATEAANRREHRPLQRVGRKRRK